MFWLPGVRRTYFTMCQCWYNIATFNATDLQGISCKEWNANIKKQSNTMTSFTGGKQPSGLLPLFRGELWTPATNTTF
ncbi:Uncharacterised protein [Salmonella enterica subsp. enterica serovar Typhimurium]|nr:hypothetical protein SEET6618_09095 [Salmonella enterica subsp. enterica serovar Typhimurium str. 36618]SUH91953.1 Uncharacterised protein [Salmonella enterica subsp. enterica serovar Typhimurium]